MHAANSQKQNVAVGSVVSVSGEEFEILEELGRGGMGCVYKAMRRGLERNVAIKFLFESEDTQATQRFLREAKLLAALSHPNIVRVDAVKAEGSPFIVMELVEGQTLAKVFETQKTLSPEQFVKYFDQLLSALEHLHREGLVHRDIKPSNIMVTTDDTIKLMDFGIAKDLEGQRETSQSMTRTGAIVGSPWYMSPEQCRAEKPDARSDLYSVGCVMYEAIAGKPPFQGENALEVMYAHINSQVTTENELALPAFSALVLKAIEKDPADRFQTAQEMRDQLHDKGAATTTRASRARRRHAKLRVATLPYLVLFTIFLAAIGWFIFTGHRHNSGAESESVGSAVQLVDDARKRFSHAGTTASVKEQARDWQEGISLCQQALNRNPNDMVKYSCYYEIGHAYQIYDPEQGKDFAEKSLELSRSHHTLKDRANALGLVIFYRTRAADWNGVIDAYKERMTIDKGTPLMRTIDTIGLANAYQQSNQIAKADELYKQALAEAKASHNDPAIAGAATELAHNRLVRLKPLEVIPYATLAISKIDKLKPGQGYAQQEIAETSTRCRTVLFHAYQLLGKTEEAKAVLEEAIKSAERQASDNLETRARAARLADLYQSLAMYYLAKGDKHNYFDACDNAIKYAMQFGRMRDPLSLFVFRFWQELERNKPENAEQIGQLAVKYADKSDNHTVRAWGYALIGRAQWRCGKLFEAREALKKAEELALEEPKNASLTDLLLNVYTPRGQTELQAGDAAAAAHYIGLMHNASQQSTATENYKKEAESFFAAYEKSLKH